METTWRVKKVVATEERVSAELVRVEWFRKNPELERMMAEYKNVEQAEGLAAADERFKDSPWVDEFLTAGPDDPEAEFVEHGDGALTIELPDDFALAAGDDVRMTLEVLG